MRCTLGVLSSKPNNTKNVMKTPIRRTALLFASAFTFLLVSASEPATPIRSTSPATMERELDRQIDKFVTYPLLQRNRMDGEVLVSFVINTEGKVKVISARSANAELCEYVLRMLSKVDIGDNPDGTWKTTHMRFKFRPEV
jgi:hypothetical protein